MHLKENYQMEHFMDIGVYCIHPMVNLFGRPNSLKANAVKLSTGVDGEGSIILEYDDMLADIRYSKLLILIYLQKSREKTEAL